MLSFPRRYWPIIPIATVFVVAVFLEWSHANGPRQPTYAAAPQNLAPAASQPPVPTAEETNNAQPQAKAGATRQQTANGQRGTNETPFVVKILNPQNASTQSAPDQNSHSDEQSGNFSLLNVLLVVATFGLFGVGLWQGIISRSTAKKQLRAYVLLDTGSVYDASRIGIQAAQPNTLLPAFTNFIAVDLDSEK